MKKYILLLSVAFIFLISCTNQPDSTHEVRYSKDGKDSVVYVQSYENGQQNNFFMNYIMFRMLFGNGGYTNVYHYYEGHPYIRSYASNYNSYSMNNTPISVRKSTSSSYYRSYSSPSRSTSSGSYSSPSRSSSSPSRSYSSPSRSYSSPSRSYSSPSRSYSSPSRSYSSPSRR